MRRALFLALVGLILISALEWGVDYQVEKYQRNLKTEYEESALLSGAVFLGLQDGFFCFWGWFHDNREVLLVLFTAALVAVTTALAAFTRGLMVYTRRLWKSTGGLVGESKDAAQRQLKAYVFVIRHELESEPRAGQSLKADLFIKNVGQTPAHDVRIDGDIVITEHPLRPGVLRELDFQTTTDFTRQTLGPTCERQKQQVTSEPLTGDQIRALMSDDDKWAVYVYGKILYEDEFGRERWTTYRYFWNGKIKALRGRTLAAHSDGNEADRDARGV